MADSLRRVSELVWHAGCEHCILVDPTIWHDSDARSREWRSDLFHASLWIWATSSRNLDSVSGISSLSPDGCEATDPASELD
eukprot:4613202-Pyramimonas_sp.AAC.1